MKFIEAYSVHKVALCGLKKVGRRSTNAIASV